MRVDYIIQNVIQQILSEGVSVQSGEFNFNYEKYSEADIIPLVTDGVEHRSFQGSDILYFAYHFNENVDRRLRTEFIHELKFSTDSKFVKERDRFITEAINRLGDSINLASYDILLFPETRSVILAEMISKIYRWERPKYGMATFELAKELPKNIRFDYESFNRDCLDTTINGRPRYTERQKAEVIDKVQQMMREIQDLEYFSIARNVSKTKYRPFIENYLKFKSAQDERLFNGLNNSKILIVDDIATSGSTLEQVLKTIQMVRDPSKGNMITLFTLIGK